MRCKIQGVFIGFVENSFKNDKGEEIKYRKIAVNSGELSNDEISVPADVSVAGVGYPSHVFVHLPQEIGNHLVTGCRILEADNEHAIMRVNAHLEERRTLRNVTVRTAGPILAHNGNGIAHHEHPHYCLPPATEAA